MLLKFMKSERKKRKMEPTNFYTYQYNKPAYVSEFMGDSTESKGANLYGLLSGNKVDVVLDNLSGYTYSLKKDIPVTLQYANRYYIFTQDDLNLWGESRTLQEARENIITEIINLYKRLNSLSANSLGPYPQNILKILKNYIEE